MFTNQNPFGEGSYGQISLDSTTMGKYGEKKSPKIHKFKVKTQFKVGNFEFIDGIMTKKVYLAKKPPRFSKKIEARTKTHLPRG